MKTIQITMTSGKILTAKTEKDITEIMEELFNHDVYMLTEYIAIYPMFVECLEEIKE